MPPTVDYDLWCGPAPKAPLMRKQLHYDWHWFWSTGNGEIGNNGAHIIDVCRWALGQDQPPPRAMSIGGRFAFDDDGETPNTQIALFDYQPAPLICEIRNLKAAKGADAMGKFRSLGQGVVIDCEGGYFAGDSTGGAVFDPQGRKIKEFRGDRKPARRPGHGPRGQLRGRGPQPEGRRSACRGPGGTPLRRLLPHGEHLAPPRQAVSARGDPGDDPGQPRTVGRLRALPRVSAGQRRRLWPPRKPSPDRG